MNTQKLPILLITLLLVILALTGCASAKTDPLPTPAALSCPTAPACPEPQACPTAATFPPAEPNAFRWDFSDMADVTITFNPDDQCTLEVNHTVSNAQWSYEIVVNDESYQNYLVVGVTLDDGKTLKDLLDYDQAYGPYADAPPFSQIKMLEIVSPESRSFHGVTLAGKPVYFVCIVQKGSENQKVINSLGPINLVKQ